MKKGMARRIFALFLAVVLSVGSMSVSVKAADEQYGSKTTNLAKGKDAWASSNQRGNSAVGITQIKNLTDGDQTSYIVLHEDDTDPWYYVDLGRSYSVNKVVALQGAASGGDYSPSYATKFAIEYTLDLEAAWQTAATVADGTEGTNTISFEPVDARYIRFHVEEIAGKNSLLYELAVYETNLGGDEPTDNTDDVMRILFIGNSLTEYNDVPNKVKNLFTHAGKEVEVEKIINLGQPLTIHKEKPETKEKILTGDFDYVVLQDKASGFKQSMLEDGVKLIYPWIEEAGAQMVLYMPWANEDKLADGQSVFTNAYVSVAKEYNAPVAPSGEAYYELYFNYDKKWYSDNIHGTDLASFVSASAIYYTISGQTTPIVFTENDKIIKDNSYDVETINLIQTKASSYTEAYRDLNNVPDITNRPTIKPVKENLARKKKAYASSNARNNGEFGKREISNLTDGSTGSYIVLHEEDPDPWFAVDLGEKMKFNQIALYWGSGDTYTDAYRVEYVIEGSDDLDTGYQEIISGESTKAEKQEIAFDTCEYQFIRVRVTKKLSTYCGLFEMEVYNEGTSEEKPGEGDNTEEPSEGDNTEKPGEGDEPIVQPPKENFARQKKAYASSNARGDGTIGVRQINNLTDGNTESFIVLHADDPDPWFAVDLGEKTKFNKLALYWGSGESYTDSYRAKYTVEGSDSLESGYEVITSAESTKAGLSEITFDRSEYQFVRIHVTEKAGAYCGLYEMEVYNEETSEEESSESSSEGSSSESSSEGSSSESSSEGSSSESSSEGSSSESSSEGSSSESPSEGESTEGSSEGESSESSSEGESSESASEGESSENPSEGSSSESASEGESSESPSEENSSEKPSEGESTEKPSESSSEGESTEKPSESSSAGGSADKADTGGMAGKLGEVNGLKISKTTSNKLTVSWSKAEADGYRIVLTRGGKIVKRVMTTKTSYTFKKLKAASVYNISVQVCKAESGGMVYGAEKKMAAKTAPAKVKMKGMTVENQVISLNWRKVKGASGYEVYVKKGNGKYKKVKTNLRKNNMKIKLNTSGAYRFRICAYTKYKSKKIRGAYVKTKAIQL